MINAKLNIAEAHLDHLNLPAFTIKTASFHDVTLMLEWARQEGWNPGLSDALSFQIADPKGFLIGYLGDEPIASLSAVCYPKQFGFLGLYIVKPDYRGQGYGFHIWQAGIDYLSGYTIGLDGVLDQQDNYKKSGFVLAYRNIRFTGVAPQNKPSVLVTPIKKVPFNLLLDYDQTVFPAPRPAFLSAWISAPHTHSYAVLEKNKVVGMGTIRKCYTGYKIGPLFANNTFIAESLFYALSQHAGKEPVFIDVPEINKAGLQFMQQLNFEMVFETARMYKGPTPNINNAAVWGVTTYELG